MVMTRVAVLFTLHLKGFSASGLVAHLRLVQSVHVSVHNRSKTMTYVHNLRGTDSSLACVLPNV